MRDIRDQESIEYWRETIIWTELIAKITKRRSRTRISHEMRTENFCENIRRLSGQKELESVPHGDTVEYFNVRARVEDFEKLQAKMIRTLVRQRVLEKFRLQNKYYMVPIDGVHIHSFDYKHCDKCQVREDEHGNKRWFHYKVQASIVTHQGFCLPIASEWIENEGNYDKQDCERKAFYRLVKKLRVLYPRLEMCLLLDNLFACQPAFNAMKKARMQYIAVFKEGSMSYIYPWVMDVKGHVAKDNIIVETEEKEIAQRNRRSHEEKLLRGKPQNKKRTVTTETTYSWVTEIEFSEERSLFNVITCKEIHEGKKVCDYAWLVSDGLNLNEDNVKQLAKAGRCRWKIENEGNNIQKNGGYYLEHLNSRDEISMKIWCVILDIAHIINQLIEKGSLITVKTYGSIRNIAQRMYEHFRYFIYQEPPVPQKMQIRLFWDTG
ncbi:MAG: hypothetical protein KAI72_10800 [Candidatus Pacebacteria bacterium]|nr:hypothetical protein [Candidatus Paceibacterota bacterium]